MKSRCRAVIAGCSLLLLIVTVAPGEGQKVKKPPVRKSFELPDLQMTLLRIEPGEFDMGSPADEPNRKEYEFQHKVRLTRLFFLQSTEVTQAQYRNVMGANPSYFRGDDLPVETVSWEEATAFCRKLNERTGRHFRLPSEAEWEYAARAGKDGPVAGTKKLDEMAWYAENSGRRRVDSAKLWDSNPNEYFKNLLDNGCGTHAVRTLKPNDWGLLDMEGNVSEWVADWFSDTYFHEDAAKLNPRGPTDSKLNSRVMRGGSWGSDPRNCRIAHRDWNVPSTRSASVGFRVAMDAE